MKLRNLEISNAKPAATVYNLRDGNGLYLVVRPTGKKIWCYDYRIGGRENTYTIGPFGDRVGEFTLAQARERRATAAALVAKGIHPRQFDKDQIAAQVTETRNTFGAMALEFLDTKRGHVTPHYLKQLEAVVNRDLAPILDTPINAVLSTQILDCMKVHANRPAWAKVIRRVVSEIYTFAIMDGRAKNDPSYPLRKAVSASGPIRSRKVQNNPHLRLDEVPALLAAVDAAPDSERVTQLGMKILILTFVRPGELAGALWSEFDFAAGLWNIPAERMKMGTAHIVPLSAQVVALLRELHGITGHTAALFPEFKARKRTGDVVTKLPNIFSRFLREIGFAGRLTAHGLRGTASTALHNLAPRFQHDWIECQLSHLPRGVSAHYNHADYIPQRTEMMQAYADMILPRALAPVVPLRLAA